jgi:hypothetical protein
LVKASVYPLQTVENKMMKNMIIKNGHLTLANRLYRVSQNSPIPNSERGREGPSGARKIHRKKIRSSWRRYKHFNFVQYIAAFISTMTKYYSSYVAVPFLRKITKL